MKKLLLVLLILFSFVACRTTKYVEVPVDRVKIEYRDREKIDTLIKNDSTIIKEKDDTIFYEKYKYIYRTKKVTDTVCRVDTITKTQVVEVTKEVNKLYNWQVVLMVLGGGAILLGVYKLYKLIKSWI